MTTSTRIDVEVVKFSVLAYADDVNVINKKNIRKLSLLQSYNMKLNINESKMQKQITEAYKASGRALRLMIITFSANSYIAINGALC